MSTETISRTIRANGLEFSYVEAGRGKLFLCLHGFPDTPHSFVHQLRELSQHGYRVVAPYLRGYAPTEIPKGGPYQPAAFGRDVVALIEALGHETATVYGHDWGSTAAHAAALRSPERIEKLIAAALPYGPSLPQSLITNARQQRRSWYVFYFQTRLAELAIPMDDYAFIDDLVQDWSPGFDFADDWKRELKACLAKSGVLTAALDYYRTAFDPTHRDPGLNAEEARFGVDPINVPALYVHGERDGCIGPEVPQGLEALYPRGLRRATLDAGHFVHLEQPAAFNRVVLEFLQAPDETPPVTP